MKEYLVKITSQAQTHLKQIVKYISYELHAPDAAVNLLDSLENAISSLSHFPNRIPLTDESPWKEKKIHQMYIKNFYVYFWVDDINLTVHILAVIYSKSNQIKQLSQIDFH